MVCYIFIFSLLFSLFARLEVCIGYFINQNYYAEVLCVNKEKEESCCMGKCAMEKELVNLAEKEEPQPGKTPAQTIKLTKSEEAVIKTITFSLFQTGIEQLHSSLTEELMCGTKTVQFKPPTSVYVS